MARKRQKNNSSSSSKESSTAAVPDVSASAAPSTPVAAKSSAAPVTPAASVAAEAVAASSPHVAEAVSLGRRSRGDTWMESVNARKEKEALESEVAYLKRRLEVMGNTKASELATQNEELRKEMDELKAKMDLGLSSAAAAESAAVATPGKVRAGVDAEAQREADARVLRAEEDRDAARKSAAQLSKDLKEAMAAAKDAKAAVAALEKDKADAVAACKAAEAQLAAQAGSKTDGDDDRVAVAEAKAKAAANQAKAAQAKTEAAEDKAKAAEARAKAAEDKAKAAEDKAKAAAPAAGASGETAALKAQIKQLSAELASSRSENPLHDVQSIRVRLNADHPFPAVVTARLAHTFRSDEEIALCSARVANLPRETTPADVSSFLNTSLGNPSSVVAVAMLPAHPDTSLVQCRSPDDLTSVLCLDSVSFKNQKLAVGRVAAQDAADLTSLKWHHLNDGVAQSQSLGQPAAPFIQVLPGEGIRVEWQPVAGATRYALAYLLQLKDQTQAEWFKMFIGPATTMSFRRYLPPGAYTFKVQAYDAASACSTWSQGTTHHIM